MGVQIVYTHPKVQTPPVVEATARRYSSGITAETTASLIEAIANDKASKLVALSRAAVIMTVCPEWMRREEVTAYFGIPGNQLTQMAIRGEVIAKKFDPTLKASAVIFKVSDIRRAIDRLTPYEQWLKDRPDMQNQNQAETEQEEEI